MFIHGFGGKTRGTRGLEEISVHGKIIFKWKFKKKKKKKEMGRGCELNWSGSGQGQMEGSCEEGDEPSVSIKRGALVDQLRKCFVDQLRNY